MTEDNPYLPASPAVTVTEEEEEEGAREEHCLSVQDDHWTLQQHPAT